MTRSLFFCCIQYIFQCGIFISIFWNYSEIQHKKMKMLILKSNTLKSVENTQNVKHQITLTKNIFVTSLFDCWDDGKYCLKHSFIVDKCFYFYFPLYTIVTSKGRFGLVAVILAAPGQKMVNLSYRAGVISKCHDFDWLLAGGAAPGVQKGKKQRRRRQPWGDPALMTAENEMCLPNLCFSPVTQEACDWW